MSGEDDLELTSEFLQHEDLQETRDYLSRGRVLSNVSDGALGERWVATFKIWLRAEFLIALRNMNDAAAELRLRDLDVPYDRVEPEMLAIQQAFVRLAPNTGPADIEHRIEAFLRERRKPLN